MLNPESFANGDNAELATKWDDLGDKVEFRQKTLDRAEIPTLEHQDECTQDKARVRVFDSYKDASEESVKNTGELESDFGRRVGELDQYIMNTDVSRESMASYVADLAGVLSGVKPSALVQVLPTDLNLDSETLYTMLTGLNLEIASGWEKGKFFISRDAETAKQLKQGFHDLWENNKTGDSSRKAEIDHRIGKLLGYPETAVNQDFSRERNPSLADRIKGIFKKRRDDTLDRHYTHSVEHAEEEFEQYEKPIHAFLDKYCPEATKVLKEERTPRGKLYRW